VKQRAKTGEKRKVRQPMNIDKLPQESRDRILELKNLGHTWMEIEEMSPAFVEWEKTPEKVVALFPGKRLPHTSLHRWYDIRVEQVRAEAIGKVERAREFATAFTSRGFKDLPEAIRNALGDMIFALSESGDAKSQAMMRKELVELGWLLQEYRKTDLKEQALDVEKQKLNLVLNKVRGLKEETAKKKLEPAELQQRLDEIYGLGN
jgi:hypothetical protein